MVRIYPGLEDLLVSMALVHQHPDNANNGDIEAIVESIQINGFYAPIVIDADGLILAGNHRYAAMAQLGASHIPAVVIDPDSVTGKRILLVDNATTRRGWDDPAQRLSLLRSIAEDSPVTGIAGTGYSHEEYLMMVREATAPLHFAPTPTTTHLDVVCRTYDEAVDLAAELVERGFEVRGAPV